MLSQRYNLGIVVVQQGDLPRSETVNMAVRVAIQTPTISRSAQRFAHPALSLDPDDNLRDGYRCRQRHGKHEHQ